MKIALNKLKDNTYEVFDTLKYKKVTEAITAEKEISDKYDVDCTQNGTFIAFNKRWDDDAVYVDLIDWSFNIKPHIKLTKLAMLYDKNGTNIVVVAQDEDKQVKDTLNLNENGERKDDGKNGKIILVDEIESEGSKPNKEKKKRNIELNTISTKDTIDREKEKEKNLSEKVDIDGSVNKYCDGVYIDASLIPREGSDEVKKAALEYQQELARLKFTFPFEAAVLYVLDRHFTTDTEVCPTLGVSPGHIYINVDFWHQMRKSERPFVLLHEAGHLILRHSARVFKRNSYLYNIAGDLIINKMLCNDLHMEYDEDGDKTISTGSIEIASGTEDVDFPLGGLLTNAIDTKEDTTEKIYDELNRKYRDLEKMITDAIKNMMKKQGQGQGQGQSGQGGGGSGQSGENSQNGGGSGGKQDIKDILEKIKSIIGKIEKKLEDPRNAAVKNQVQKKLEEIKQEVAKL